MSIKLRSFQAQIIRFKTWEFFEKIEREIFEQINGTGLQVMFDLKYTESMPDVVYGDKQRIDYVAYY